MCYTLILTSIDFYMTNEELIDTLRIASKSVNENIALAMLLTMAAERIEELTNG